MDQQDQQAEERESIGRIEIAPDVLTTIARYVTLSVEGVNKLAPVPADVSRLFSRAVRDDGVLLDYLDGRLAFDIYVLVDPHVSVLETSRRIQEAVVEAIDKMVGIPVQAVNVHVEDVIYAYDETA
ncbi:MAG: Asp23/Gls24 family envelope stress response protein [Candidatus Promineifilaceae bacterium]|nr:Asp23/Gls24 family envelope stress response protein [Candidatus Promineifilaceae bacterium]